MTFAIKSNIHNTNFIFLAVHLYHRVRLEESNETPKNVFPKGVFSRDASLSLQSHSEYILPKQVEWKLPMVSPVYHLSIVMEEGVLETCSFVLKDIVLEYKSDLVGVKQKHVYKSLTYYCDYLGTYISAGIPLGTFEWVFGEAKKILDCPISSNVLGVSEGYRWVFAEIQESVGCYAYSSASKDFEYMETLREAMCAIKSNVIGEGHFEIAVMHHSVKYFLKFTLTKFQLINTTSNKPNAAGFFTSRIEPAKSLMNILTKINDEETKIAK